MKAAEVPQAAVPAPEKKAEDLASQLSKSDSLAAKLELLKADETMTSQQKLQLMQEQLSAKEWNAFSVEEQCRLSPQSQRCEKN